jgi:CubicO group peptidase (beta-lactamase class C family)
MSRRLAASVRRALDAVMAQYVPHRVPAAVLSVWDDDGERETLAWGAQPHDHTAADAEMLFDLASVTKISVSTAFLMLVSQGRVRLKDPLVSVIPEFGGAPRPVDGGQDPHTKAPLPTPPALADQQVDPQAVTFYHLLTHTSGIAPWRDIYRAAGPTPRPPQEPDPVPRAVRWQRGIAAVCAAPFVAPPDATIRYSDLGLMLLGESVARLAGQPLDAALAALLGGVVDDVGVFSPVREHGIPLARIAPTEDDPAWRGRRAWGEVHDENACGLGGVSGHAGLFNHARGVSQLAHRWLTGRLPIDPQLQAQATRPCVVNGNDRRGLGFMIKALEGSSAGDKLSEATYGHTGFTGTAFYVDPVHRQAITLLTNAVYYGRDTMPSYELRRAVYETVAEDFV